MVVFSSFDKLRNRFLRQAQEPLKGSEVALRIGVLYRVKEFFFLMQNENGGTVLLANTLRRFK